MTLYDAIPLFLTNLVAISAIMVLLWLVSIPLKSVSFIDSVWSLGFIFVAIMSYVILPTTGIHKDVILILTIVWGIRLSAHLFIRWYTEGEDPRYAKMIERSKYSRALFTLCFVFLFQGLLIVILSAPVQFGMLSATSQTLGYAAFAGMAIWAIGFYFEAVGDWQLRQFKRDPNNRGKVMNKGLWRLTRHPNYFGDACLWWGIWLIAADAGVIGYYSIFAPLILTYILMNWSGVPLLEHGLKKRKDGYEEYIRTTNRFFPGLPKQ